MIRCCKWVLTVLSICNGGQTLLQPHLLHLSSSVGFLCYRFVVESFIYIDWILASSSSFSLSSLGRKLKNGSENEVYEIDYRGPETHSSSFPPPDNSNGSPQILTRSNKQSHTQLQGPKTKVSNAATTKHKVLLLSFKYIRVDHRTY